MFHVKHFWRDLLDGFYMWIAWRLPDRLVAWCAVRVAAWASAALPEKAMGEITVFEANAVWGDRNV